MDDHASGLREEGMKMAVTTTATRTNYFKVTDPEAFKAFVARIQCSNGSDVKVIQNVGDDGITRYGFDVFDDILGIAPPEILAEDEDDWGDVEFDYGEPLLCLSELVAEDDAAIIIASGYEGLRYVNGWANIVTRSEITCYDLQLLAAQSAAKMLKNLKLNY